MQAQPQVRVDGVGAGVLLDVGPQLVDQADPPALVAAQVQHDPSALGGDHPQRRPELHPAVAAQRADGVAGEALGVQPGQHRAPVAEVTRRPGEVHVPGRGLEGPGPELAVRRGDRRRRDLRGGCRPAIRPTRRNHRARLLALVPTGSARYRHAAPARGVTGAVRRTPVHARRCFSSPRARSRSVPVELPDPGPGELLVRTRFSGISTGTELLAYRGLLDPDLPVDERIGALGGTFRYPFRYGYSCVGEVEQSDGAVPAGRPGVRLPPAPGPIRRRRGPTSSRSRRAPIRAWPRCCRCVETGLQLSLDAGSGGAGDGRGRRARHGRHDHGAAAAARRRDGAWPATRRPSGAGWPARSASPR